MKRGLEVDMELCQGGREDSGSTHSRWEMEECCRGKGVWNLEYIENNHKEAREKISRVHNNCVDRIDGYDCAQIIKLNQEVWSVIFLIGVVTNNVKHDFSTAQLYNRGDNASSQQYTPSSLYGDVQLIPAARLELLMLILLPPRKIFLLVPCGIIINDTPVPIVRQSMRNGR